MKRPTSHSFGVPRRRTEQRRVAMAMAVLLSGICHFAAAEPLEVYDFGTCSLYEQKQYVFAITNAGMEALNILSVEPSCPCVHIMQWPTQVAANGVGWLDVILAPDVLGSVEYRIRVTTARPSEPVLEYAIRGVVTGGVAIVKEPDKSLYVEANEAASLVKNPEQAVWVDVRDGASFSAAHIPGALNIPAYAVKTKSFLRNGKVVWGGYGFESTELEAEAARLKGLGFDVRLWYGGIRGWQRWGGRLEGADVTRLKWLPASAWPGILNRTDWALVSVDGKGLTNGINIVYLPWDAREPTNFVKAVNAFLEEHSEIGCLAIGNSDGQQYDEIERVAGSIPAVLFYVEGGWQAAQQHLNMLSQVKRGEVRVAQSGGYTRPLRPGCGSCGR
jgi:rhodanese-related sulfurtransferase